jgi:hypothetical protein
LVVKKEDGMKDEDNTEEKKNEMWGEGYVGEGRAEKRGQESRRRSIVRAHPYKPRVGHPQVQVGWAQLEWGRREAGEGD